MTANRGCGERRHVSGAFLALALLATSATAEETTITPSGAEDFAPVWSPDARRIACLTKVGDAMRLCLMAVDGSSRATFAQPEGNAVRVAWGPEGRRLALETVAGSGREIWLVQPALRRIGAGREPAFSADGRWLAYATDEAILVVEPDHGGQRALARGGVTAGFANPTWTPDSRRVFYTCDGSLWQVDVDGRSAPRILLRKDRYPYRKAVCSPTGDRILVIGDSSVATGEQAGDPLWLLDSNGAAALVRLPAGYSPSWVGAGEYILCSRQNELFRIDCGGGQRRVAPGRAPTVSPDGARAAAERMVADGEADALFGTVRKSKIVVLDLAAPAAGTMPSPSSASLASGAIAPGWTIRVPAAVDIGLRDRLEAVARVTLVLAEALRETQTRPRAQPGSLRVYEKHGGGWAEVPSGIYPDPEAPGWHELVWLMPGKHEMLTEPQYLLCFRPQGDPGRWRRPGEWRYLAPQAVVRNLVPNPDLEGVEDGQLQGWSAVAPRDPADGSAVLEGEKVYRGKRCLRLTAAVRTANPAWHSSVFELEQKTSYLVSFAVRSEIAEGYDPVVWLYYLDRAGKRVCNDITLYRTAIRQPPGSPEWQQVEQRVQTPAGTTHGKLRVMLYTSVGSGWLDSFAVVPFEKREDLRVIVRPTPPAGE